MPALACHTPHCAFSILPDLDSSRKPSLISEAQRSWRHTDKQGLLLPPLPALLSSNLCTPLSYPPSSGKHGDLAAATPPPSVVLPCFWDVRPQLSSAVCCLLPFHTPVLSSPSFLLALPLLTPRSSTSSTQKPFESLPVLLSLT